MIVCIMSCPCIPVLTVSRTTIPFDFPKSYIGSAIYLVYCSCSRRVRLQTTRVCMHSGTTYFRIIVEGSNINGLIFGCNSHAEHGKPVFGRGVRTCKEGSDPGNVTARTQVHPGGDAGVIRPAMNQSIMVLERAGRPWQATTWDGPRPPPSPAQAERGKAGLRLAG